MLRLPDDYPDLVIYVHRMQSHVRLYTAEMCRRD